MANYRLRIGFLASYLASAEAGSYALTGQAVNFTYVPAATGGSDTPPTTANNVYIRSGGTGSGTSWSDARGSLPTLARNTTYWCGGGLSLGNISFTTANSGTSPVVIRKATIADHGTETGWNNSYASGQSTFGQILVQRDYLYVYGGERNETTWNATSSYGFKIDNLYATTDTGVTVGNNLTVVYCDIGKTYNESPSSGTIATYGVPVYMAGSTTKTGWSIIRCAIHNGKGTLFQNADVENMLVERCWIGPGWGKEAIRGQGIWNNNVIRWNVFYNSSQLDPNDGTSGITAEIGAFSNAGGGGSYNGNYVYGNVFYSNVSNSGRNAVIVIGGGPGWDGNAGNNNKVWNNTIVKVPLAATSPMILLNGGTGNEIRNTLFYDTVDADVSANTTSNNVDATVDPFVNYAALDLRITSGSQARNAGVGVGGGVDPYNKDIAGNTRGSDGTWDVGAYEYTP
jgi:hypothetical protein